MLYLMPLSLVFVLYILDATVLGICVLLYLMPLSLVFVSCYTWCHCPSCLCRVILEATVLNVCVVLYLRPLSFMFVSYYTWCHCPWCLCRVLLDATVLGVCVVLYLIPLSLVFLSHLMSWVGCRNRLYWFLTIAVLSTSSLKMIFELLQLNIFQKAYTQNVWWSIICWQRLADYWNIYSKLKFPLVQNILVRDCAVWWCC